MTRWPNASHRMLAAALVLGLRGSSLAADEWRTTSSLIGESKYGDNFQHYDYVNPDAPKGGTLNSVVLGTFDSFNPYIVQGPRRRSRASSAAACSMTR